MFWWNCPPTRRTGMIEETSKTYNIHYLRMDEVKWKALGSVYERLPEFAGYFGGIPFWFGVEPDDADAEMNTSAHYLRASVEPSGLVIEGYLPSEEWNRWQEAFVSLASSALGFAVMAAEDDCEWLYGSVQ